MAVADHGSHSENLSDGSQTLSRVSPVPSRVSLSTSRFRRSKASSKKGIWSCGLTSLASIPRISRSTSSAISLTIKGHRKEDQEVKEEDYIRREISYGSFERRIGLLKGVDASRINATWRDGMLEITIPLHAEAAESRKINVEVGTVKASPKVST